MHYFPDAFTYFGILFLLIFCVNVNMRLAFFFRFSNNSTIFYVKWPISNNFVTAIILESFHASPIDNGHFRLLEGFFDGCSMTFGFFVFMANRETQCCIFDTTDGREKYCMATFFKANDMGKQNAEHCFVCFDDK